MLSKNRWDKGIEPDTNFTKLNFNKILKVQKNQREKDEFYNLTIFEKKTGNIIGSVSAMNIIRSVTHSCYLGYFINNIYWGMGFGKEATNAMIHFCFKELKLHRIEAGIEPSNRRSILLAKSLGLRKEGLKKRVVFLRNEWQDLTMYSATCEEFGYNWKT
jgi:ribosomal-protein-alanine N-acetyltransferase